MILSGAKLSCRWALGRDGVQSGMWIRLVLFGFILFAFGWASRGRPSASPDKAMADLQSQINALYSKSVTECAAFHAGDQECIKSQFQANYRWEILRDQDRLIGPPGIPGPSLSGNAANTDAAQRVR